jgi:adenylylsulfate reductase subunit B
MTVYVAPDLCRGCGKCLFVCPGDLIQLEGALAEVVEPDLCWSCAACLKSCPYEAIGLSLTPPEGGRGLRLTAKREGSRLTWRARNGNYEAVVVTDSANDRDY